MVGFFIFDECKDERHKDCVRFVPATEDERGRVCRCKCHYPHPPDMRPLPSYRDKEAT